jgi:hypothetical protein
LFFCAAANVRHFRPFFSAAPLGSGGDWHCWQLHVLRRAIFLHGPRPGGTHMGPPRMGSAQTRDPRSTPPFSIFLRSAWWLVVGASRRRPPRSPAGSQVRHSPGVPWHSALCIGAAYLVAYIHRLLYLHAYHAGCVLANLSVLSKQLLPVSRIHPSPHARMRAKSHHPPTRPCLISPAWCTSSSTTTTAAAAAPFLSHSWARV